MGGMGPRLVTTLHTQDPSRTALLPSRGIVEVTLVQELGVLGFQPQRCNFAGWEQVIFPSLSLSFPIWE